LRRQTSSRANLATWSISSTTLDSSSLDRCDQGHQRGRPVSAVLHFASPASPEDYLHFPIQTLKVGALATHNALGLAKAKPARFPTSHRPLRRTGTRWIIRSLRITGAT
jgi:hypothetical protein